MYRVKLHEVPGEIRTKICAELDKISREAVHMSYKSIHYDDSYLFVVIAILQDKEIEDSSMSLYSVHTFNSTFGELNGGTYSLNYEEALMEMSRRLHFE